METIRIQTSNDAELTVRATAEGATIGISSGGQRVVAHLDHVNTQRLASHVARDIGLLPGQCPLWTLPGDGGLCVGEQVGDEWWAISMTNPRDHSPSFTPEPLWPLICSTQRRSGQTAPCGLVGTSEICLAHYDAERGVAVARNPIRGADPGDDGKNLYKLQYHRPHRAGNGFVGKWEVSPLDLDARSSRVLIRPVGLVLSDAAGSLSCVLNVYGYEALVEALFHTFRRPSWMAT